tara:strand:- start:2559 stop:5588 length:3030 start_codon:yes stop_codon:yes gene_type:complete
MANVNVDPALAAIERLETIKDIVEAKWDPQLFLSLASHPLNLTDEKKMYENLVKIVGNPSVAMQKMAGKTETAALMDLTPPQLSALMPKMRLYKVSIENGRITGKIPIPFEDRLTKESVEQMTENRAGRGAGASLVGFEYKLNGKNSAEIDFLEATISLKFQTFYDMYVNRNAGGPKVSFLDLIATPSDPKSKKIADSTIKPLSYGEDQIRIEVGWTVPRANMSQNLGFTSQQIRAIKKATSVIYLARTQHELKINSDGTVSLDITYHSRLEGILRTTSTDLLRVNESSQTRQQARDEYEKVQEAAKEFERANQALSEQIERFVEKDPDGAADFYYLFIDSTGKKGEPQERFKKYSTDVKVKKIKAVLREIQKDGGLKTRYDNKGVQELGDKLVNGGLYQGGAGSGVTDVESDEEWNQAASLLSSITGVEEPQQRVTATVSNAGLSNETVEGYIDGDVLITDDGRKIPTNLIIDTQRTINFNDAKVQALEKSIEKIGNDNTNFELAKNSDLFLRHSKMINALLREPNAVRSVSMPMELVEKFAELIQQLNGSSTAEAEIESLLSTIAPEDINRPASLPRDWETDAREALQAASRMERRRIINELGTDDQVSALDEADRQQTGWSYDSSAEIEENLAEQLEITDTEQVKRALNGDKYILYYTTFGAVLNAAINLLNLKEWEKENLRIALGDVYPSGTALQEQISAKKGNIRKINLADLPLSMDTVEDFLVQKIIRPRRERYYLLDFIKDLFGFLSKAISLITGNISGSMSVVKPRRNVFITSLPLLKDGKDSITRQKGWGKAVVNAEAMENVHQTEPASASKNVDYIYLYSLERLQGDYSGNREEDDALGIPHFVVGQDRGLVKTIKYNKVDQPKLEESRIANTIAGTAGELDLLTQTYDAEIEMFGNNLLEVGGLIYINPYIMTRAGKEFRDQIDIIEKLGFGGYYRVLEILNTYDSSGYKTKVTAAFEAKKTKSSKVTTLGEVSLGTPKGRVEHPTGEPVTINGVITF